MDEHEVTKAALIIKEYCSKQKDCEGCMFYRDYREPEEAPQVCELTRYTPYTWQIRRGRNNEAESQADNTGD